MKPCQLWFLVEIAGEKMCLMWKLFISKLISDGFVCNLKAADSMPPAGVAYVTWRWG